MSVSAQKQKDFIFSSRERFKPVRPEGIYGAGHLLKQADEIVDLLKNYRIYRDAGVSFGGGVLFVGPPGTGKTLLARYVATMSGARFINMRKIPISLASGTGVHVWRPQDISNVFKFAGQYVAEHNRPVVLFIDQFDNWLDVHKNAVDQLEIELDGFSGRRKGVYLIATAKEKPEGSTLFRGKRIDKTISFSLPDRKQRLALLGGFISRYPHQEGIGLRNLSCMLRDSSPAAIESAVDEAYQLCVRRVKMAEAEAKIALLLGRTKPTRHPPNAEVKLDNGALIEIFLVRATEAETGQVFSANEERKTAIHELGHYVVARALGLPTQFFTVRPTEENLGITFTSGGGAIKSLEVDEARRYVAKCLGSVKIEEFWGLPPQGGSEGDLEMATDFTKQIVFTSCYKRSKSLGEYGLMSIGLGDEEGSPAISNHLRMKLEKEVGLVLREEAKRCERIFRFFGKKVLERILAVFLARPNKVMLQAEIDPFLEPKLSEYHRKYKIKDLILEENW